MNRIRFLDNPVQHYAWGSRSVIAELQGRPAPSPEPEAELWMGAHPKAPSMVHADGLRVPLDEWIRRDPPAVLGVETALGFGTELPFLMKVLAAAAPLSIQAHPDAQQAAEGFARENRAGIDLAAPERNYRDPNPKPELICALTPFWAVNGFRPVLDIVRLVRALEVPALDALADRLERTGSIRDAFETLLTMRTRERRTLVDAAATAARGLAGTDPAYAWIGKLALAYPGDAGVLCPVLLNTVRLQPGQAMFLPARRLHAYLDGAGIEIMASSDNVLRGGLTPKHVDVPELLEVLSFEPSDPGVTGPLEASPMRSDHVSPARQFALSVLEVRPGDRLDWTAPGAVQILLCSRGRAVVAPHHGQEPLELEQGGCLLVPGAAPAWSMTGDATVHLATVP